MIGESEEYVWLCVDQYPITAIEPIRKALKRGVQFKIIESKDILSKPDLDLDSPEDMEALAGTRRLPLGQQKILDRIDVFLAVTESKCAVAFPDRSNQFDYLGFTSKDDRFCNWCRDLFEVLWSRSR
jgi:predicted transcriptional regulator